MRHIIRDTPENHAVIVAFILAVHADDHLLETQAIASTSLPECTAGNLPLEQNTAPRRAANIRTLECGERGGESHATSDNEE